MDAGQLDAGQAEHDHGTRSRIQVLPERVRNQIAAGEVIERPASVVKELLENALDAGARNVRIDLEEGGSRLIRVVDDGSGMSREDLELAFLAHATSKLHAVEDLEHIASLGFRGEALASMGSVARCAILTREAGTASGNRIECEGSKLSPAREAGCPEGTLVEVRDLFFNVPARRRFLKQTATELGRCMDIVQRLALAHERVGFIATHDGRRVFDVEPSMDLRARIRRAFGADLEAALAPVEARDGDVSLRGFVAPPRLARGDTARQMWFLNGRAVRDKVLVRALKEGYRGFLFESRQPVAFLHLAMDPAKVDVNVHPAKSEVRFREERRLFGFLVNAIRAAVRATNMATPGERLVETALRREAREAGSVSGAAAFFSLMPQRMREPYEVREVPTPERTADRAREPEAPPATPEVHGPFLQIDRTYILRPTGDGFEIVDQHALHERIQFEALAEEMRRGAVETQRLLVPELVELSRAEVLLLADHFDALARIGFELSAFGETTVAVNGLPARLARPRGDAAGSIVRDVLALIENQRELTADRLLEEVLHRAACRSSVMAGDALSDEEMRALLERGRHLLSDQTCVHGRPTRVRFAAADLEKAFNRR